MIIFDEYDYLNELVKNGTKLGNKNAFELQLVANYFRESGLSNEKIYNNLDIFCNEFIKNYNKDINYKFLYKIIDNSNGKHLKRATSINITENELKVIQSESSLKVQKVMFVYLVLAKYYKSNNSSSLKYYVGCKDNDIFKLSKSYFRKQEKLDIMYYLTQKKYITPTLNMSSIVNFVDENSKIIISLIPREDMEYYYERYLGKKIIECEKCGILIKKNSNSHKYCKKCAKK